MSMIGIDLGTSNSAAAVLRGGRPVIIPSAEGVSLGPQPQPDVRAASGDARPSGAGPRGRVIDAEYRESKP